MANRLIETDEAPAPFSAYSQAVETPAGARLLHVSGQVGVTLDGELPSDPVEQHLLAWRNVIAILTAARMRKEDIVEVIAIVTDHDQVANFRVVRDRMLEGGKPASTLIVAGLANPDWKVEIAVRAARSD